MANLIYDNSVFAKYFNSNDADVLAWANNVLAKLYAQGIVPKYIPRGNDNSVEDSDYLAYWTPVAIFFGYLVRLSRELENFKSDVFLSDEFLNQQGQFTSGNEALDQLAYSITYSLKRRAQRGTIKSIEQVTGPYAAPTSKPNGEILTLLNWNYYTFFKLGVAQSKHNSWNVNNASPLNRSTTGRLDLNLAYEYSKDIYDISKYPILNPTYVHNSTYKGKRCIEIEQLPFGQSAGIGLSDLTKEIIIDPRLNYEITFNVAQDVTLENLTFGCLAFDANGDPTELKDIHTGNNRNFFFETRRLNKSGTFYQIRGILYSMSSNLLSDADATLNIGFGHNLQTNPDVVSIIPYIIMDNNASDDTDSENGYFDSDSISFDVYTSGSDESGHWSEGAYDGQASIFIWNLKVNPCNTNYNRCYLNNKNFIDVFAVNNNGKYNNNQIDDILRKYFIPYNTAFKTTFVGEISELNPSASFLLLESGDYILLENESRILLE